MSRQTNWAKVGALAGVAGAAIAVLTFATSHGPSPGQHPSPQYSQQPASNTAAPQGSTAASPGSLSGAGIASPIGPPAGCQRAQAAITAFNNTVGSTWNSRLNASLRAANEITGAMEASGNGTIYDDLTALYNDFEHMSQYAGGQQTSGYSSSAEQANVDAQQLNKDCNSA